MTQIDKEVKDFIKKNEEAFKEGLENGEHYNIFDELNLNTNENRHSLFIASLLRPNGLHGLKEEPLKKFLSVIGKEGFFSKPSEVIVKTEAPIETGRLDIILEGVLANNKKKGAIIIENKIYAKDLKEQLVKYYNYGLSKYDPGNFELFYLSLKGTDIPKEISVTQGKYVLELNTSSDKFPNTYRHITYNEHIIKWLNCVNSNSLSFYNIIAQQISILEHLVEEKHHLAIKPEVEDITIENLIVARDKLREEFMNYLKDFLNDPVAIAVEVLRTIEGADVDFERTMGGDVQNFVGLKVTKDGKTLWIEIQDWSRIIYGVWNEKKKDKRETLENLGYQVKKYWYCKEFKIYTDQGLTFQFYDDRLNFTLMENGEQKAEEFAKLILEELAVVTPTPASASK